jgi:hypothetical protein
MERRALYTSLRMNWLLDPAIEVEQWQVTDYRSLSLEELFEGLADVGLAYDQKEFLAFAEEFETPDEMIQSITEELDTEAKDRAELYLFELWRRLCPEKLSLSIFCDELDRQIFIYDQDAPENEEAVEDILANLKMFLDDYTDEGYDPLQLFDTFSSGCANDVENFLYDYIAAQINSGNVSYAAELIDGFAPYIPTSKWFDFFHARLIADTDPIGANMIIADLVEEAEDEHDIEFDFALLAFLVQQGDHDLFLRVVSMTLPLLNFEEDFQELLSMCVDHYRLLDDEEHEHAVQRILDGRDSKDPDAEIDQNDPDFKILLSTIR